MNPHVEAAYAAVVAGDILAAEHAVIEAEADTETPPYVVLCIRGAIAMRTHDWLTARDYFERAVELDSLPAAGHANLGCANLEIGRFDTAIIDFRRAIARDHRLAGAWSKLGACHAMLQQHPEALACIERAVWLDPDNAGAHQWLATVLSLMGEEDGALHHYRRAQILTPGYAEAEAGEGFTLLRMGRWQEGWPKFEARWRLRSPVAPWSHRGVPLYTGDLEGLRGKRVLLRSEQGFGDTIQFARFVAPLKGIAAEITLQAPPSLVRLMRALPCDVIGPIDRLPDFDAQTSLMSLPLLFDTTPETVPPPVNLHISLESPNAYVGVCWAGGPRPDDPNAHASDKRRSLHNRFQINDLTGAIRSNGYTPVSLQQDDLTPGSDWLFTAFRVSTMGLVITVDTAMAHLAASMGVPTWMLCRFDSCWRWGLTGATTPWYPSMRIFRQPALGDWDSVIRDVRKALEARRGN